MISPLAGANTLAHHGLGSGELDETEDRFERVRSLGPALDPIIDICLKLGVNTQELESLVRVRFVQRAAKTLPGTFQTGRGPSHEAIGLATGLNRGDVQNVLAQGTDSASMRMRHKSARHSKSERVLSTWTSNSRFLSNAGTPIDLPLDLQGDGPTFEELVETALPGKKPKLVLKELRRRNLVNVLDEFVRFRPRAARVMATEMNVKALEYAGDQLQLLGNTLIGIMSGPGDRSGNTINAYVASDPVELSIELIESNKSALLRQMSAIVQSFEQDFGRQNKKKTTRKKGQILGDRAPMMRKIGISLFTWEIV